MGLGIGTIQPTKNTANLIADALRSAILQGKLHSGQSLRQDQIASEFNVSKIPVREALVQLQGEGLVDLFPSRGATVSQLTYTEVDEIYTMRIALEQIALREAIPNLTSANFYEVEGILERIDHAEDMSKWAELNWEFHATLYRPSNMPRVISTAQTLHNNVARYLLMNYLDKDYLAESQRQHREILLLCREGNVEGAISKLVAHLGDTVDEFHSLLPHDDNK